MIGKTGRIKNGAAQTPPRLTGAVEQLAEALMRSHEAACITDAENRIVFVNPAFEGLYGMGLRKMAGESPALLLSPRCHAKVADRVATTTRQQGRWQGELLNVTGAGREIKVRLSTSALVTRGKVSGMVGFATPVPVIPEELSAAQKAIYQMLGEGKQPKEIAGALGRSINTIRTQMERMLEKLPGVRDAHDLICHAVRTVAAQP